MQVAEAVLLSGGREEEGERNAQGGTGGGGGGVGGMGGAPASCQTWHCAAAAAAPERTTGGEGRGRGGVTYGPVTHVACSFLIKVRESVWTWLHLRGQVSVHSS